MTEYEIVVKPVVTLSGLVMLVREGEGKWRLPGFQVSGSEEVDRAVEKGMKDMLELEVHPHQLIDAVNTGDAVEIYLHAEAPEKDTGGDLEVNWVDPAKLEEYVEEDEETKLERRELGNFLEKLKRMPTRGDL